MPRKRKKKKGEIVNVGGRPLKAYETQEQVEERISLLVKTMRTMGRWFFKQAHPGTEEIPRTARDEGVGEENRKRELRKLWGLRRKLQSKK